uniref:Uncharacterized protein n=1 Tax=Anguilla anguilla TaxID=7936 RepID=A0A0E9S7Y6_ANGAN
MADSCLRVRNGHKQYVVFVNKNRLG